MRCGGGGRVGGSQFGPGWLRGTEGTCGGLQLEVLGAAILFGIGGGSGVPQIREPVGPGARRGRRSPRADTTAGGERCGRCRQHTTQSCVTNPHARTHDTHTRTTRPQVGPQDFEMLRVVGQGAFGKVFQVMHKATKTIYAMKVRSEAKHRGWGRVGCRYQPKLSQTQCSRARRRLPPPRTPPTKGRRGLRPPGTGSKMS